MSISSSEIEASLDMDVYKPGAADVAVGPNLFKLRCLLLHTWKDDLEMANPPMARLYSHWLDTQNEIIEGVTEPGDIVAIMPLLEVGRLYDLHNPNGLEQRLHGKTSPAPCRVQIDVALAFTPIIENPFDSMYPRDRFYLAQAATLWSRVGVDDMYHDVVGRIVSITDIRSSPGGKIAFTVILEEESSFKMIVSFDNKPTDDFTHERLAAHEANKPVICIFKNVFVSHREETNLDYVITSTSATRIVMPPYASEFRYLFDHFSHIHTPIQLMCNGNQSRLTFIRGELPHKVNLFNLLNDRIYSMSPRSEITLWCYVSVDLFYEDIEHVVQANHSARYQVVAHCSDAYASTDLLFSPSASRMLLKMPAYEFIGANPASRSRKFRRLGGKELVVELSAIPPGCNTIATHYVRTIWRPKGILG